VLFGWVGVDRSNARVVVISLHLANTFFLLASLALTAWWASRPTSVPTAVPSRGRRVPQAALLALALAGVVLVGMTGAVTALGDTLFPARSLAEGIQQDFSPTAELLIRLRVIHPVVAVAFGTLILVLSFFLTGVPGSTSSKLAIGLRLLVAAQLIAGAVNVALAAPTWMQILHLLLADLVWITLVLYTAALLAPLEQRSETVQVSPAYSAGTPAE
jgi:heme A synthase